MAKHTEDAPAKAGVESLSKKEDNTRHGFDPDPAAAKTAGAFGKERPAGERPDGNEREDEHPPRNVPD